MEKEAIMKMKVSELRLMIRDQRKYPLDVVGAIITEFKRRIPYCEGCGDKTPIWVYATIVEGATPYERLLCPACKKAMFDTSEDYCCLGDKE